MKDKMKKCMGIIIAMTISISTMSMQIPVAAAPNSTLYRSGDGIVQKSIEFDRYEADMGLK